VAKPLDVKYKSALNKSFDEPREIFALANVIREEFDRLILVCRMLGPNLSNDILNA